MPGSSPKMLLRLIIVGLLISMMAGAAHAQSPSPPSDSAAYVNDVETATAIGRAVLKERLGAQIVADREPLLAKLDDQGIWMVYGSPVKNSTKVGGGIFIKIRRSNGEILGFGVLP